MSLLIIHRAQSIGFSSNFPGAIEILVQLPAPFINTLVNICTAIESISF